jgi:hypothetical protein
MEELIEKAKTDRKILRKLKMIAVECHLYELGASLRTMETTLFPEKEEHKLAKEHAKDINLLFRMVGLDVSKEQCWIINEALAVYRKKKKKFDLKDAAAIKAKFIEIFD